jgi:hypothetical protein
MGLRGTTLALVGGLLAIGLYSASPFLSDRMLGTGEAYNYSLSVADAVTQMRAGVFPPLAGQTLYAFNGRVHPLRNAPYLHYLAYALDVASLHRLTFWQLQDASLALSIILAGLACYLGLRRGLECPPWAAFALSAVYGLSPALLGAAYSFDLYMTVHAAVFVPLAIGACLRGCLRPSFSADAWLAAALAGAWFAHPPVALWLTAGVAWIRILAFLADPGWRELRRGAAGAALAAGLASFVFVSAASLRASLETLSAGGSWAAVPPVILQNLRLAFPASLLPVSHDAGKPSDLQFGYVPWILLALTIAGLCRLDWRRNGRNRAILAAGAGSVAFVCLILLMVLPVHDLTRFLWDHVPYFALELTALWPTQRLYLVAVSFTLFGAALVLPRGFAGFRLPWWLGALAVILGLAWTFREARPFVRRGFGDRWTSESSQAAYRPSNIDITITSYAYLDSSPTFVNGSVDPQYEFRLLRGGIDEITSPLTAAVVTAPVVDRGIVQPKGIPAITLQPGRRYLLTFNFLTPPNTGYLQLIGPMTRRSYALPSAGSFRGFGMLAGERRTISIWTDGDRPERIEMRFSWSLLQYSTPAGFAEYTLQEVRPGDLPIRLEGYLPLRFSVDSPGIGCTVETPQRFILGYEAKVNGEAVTPLASPDRQVMVPLPAGHSEVELVYRGPPAARAAFWICLACWAAFAAWRICGSPVPVFPSEELRTAFAGAFRFIRGNTAACIAGAACAAALIAGAVRYGRHRAYLGAIGPIQIRFMLPYGKYAANEPLLATGRVGAGVIVCVNCIDSRHVRLSADLWGRYYETGPIELDFFRPHTLVISDSALYPPDNPAFLSLTPNESSRLLSEFRADLDGQIAMKREAFAYGSKISEILVGRSDFGSINTARFSGTILGVRRLPIPRSLVLPWGRFARVSVRFPTGRAGKSEPILASISGAKALLCYATYLSADRLKLTCPGPDGAPRSSEVVYDPIRSHEIDIRSGVSNDAALAQVMECAFDGRELFGPRPFHPSSEPPLVVSGLDDSGAPGILDRFTGPRMQLDVVADRAPTGAPAADGPVHLVIGLAAGKAGRSDPLVSTGHTGAADLVYVNYSDATHVRIGIDHWASPGAISDPIPVDYKVPHEIWVDMASLNSPAGQSAGSPVTVIFDGKVALASPIRPFPSTPDEVAIAKNQVGASTTDPSFGGVLYFVERLGPAAIPAPQS